MSTRLALDPFREQCTLSSDWRYSRSRNPWVVWHAYVWALTNRTGSSRMWYRKFHSIFSSVIGKTVSKSVATTIGKGDAFVACFKLSTLMFFLAARCWRSWAGGWRNDESSALLEEEAGGGPDAGATGTRKPAETGEGGSFVDSLIFFWVLLFVAVWETWGGIPPPHSWGEIASSATFRRYSSIKAVGLQGCVFFPAAPHDAEEDDEPEPLPPLKGPSSAAD
mmetsp:Transcript_18710/g.46750  ORF Transcript_18710/g.46750 Transcript_18710/m.46750 type:complete len:222 (-) Transcript_18710:34-699(-)